MVRQASTVGSLSGAAILAAPLGETPRPLFILPTYAYWWAIRRCVGAGAEAGRGSVSEPTRHGVFFSVEASASAPRGRSWRRKTE